MHSAAAELCFLSISANKANIMWNVKAFHCSVGAKHKQAAIKKMEK